MFVAWGFINMLLKPIAAVDKVAAGVFLQTVWLIPGEGRFLIEELRVHPSSDLCALLLEYIFMTFFCIK